MPKIVDHDARRTAIGRAVARLIEREGLGAVSVRAVAGEAGMEPSTLRHYFPSSDEMLGFALSLLRRDQEARLAALPRTGDALADLRAAWLQSMPLDAARRTECHVWVAVTAAARTPLLRGMLEEVDEGLDHLSRATVAACGVRGDAGLEAMGLRAFTDGLALNAVTQPEVFTPELVERLLDSRLRRLRDEGAAGGR